MVKKMGEFVGRMVLEEIFPIYIFFHQIRTKSQNNHRREKNKGEPPNQLRWSHHYKGEGAQRRRTRREVDKC